MREPLAIAIMGPTAVGKSEVAEQIAEALGCRIVNADAFQIYRGFDIGTAKPAVRSNYELIDICEPHEAFSAGRFVELASPHLLNRTAVVCGGTGLYVRALFDGYQGMQASDPELRAWVRRRLEEVGADALAREYGIGDPSVIANSRRLTRAVEKMLSPEKMNPVRSFPGRRIKFGLHLSREQLQGRIRRRVEGMVQNGFLQEVESLLAKNISLDAPAFRAIGYREMASVLRGDCTLEEATEKTIIRTNQYAKRQMTWLRKEQGLHWMDATATPGEICLEIMQYIREEKTSGQEH